MHKNYDCSNEMEPKQFYWKLVTTSFVQEIAFGKEKQSFFPNG